jgi:hypothetical protein
MLDAEADRVCNAQRYERSEARQDTRIGHFGRTKGPKNGRQGLLRWKPKPLVNCSTASFETDSKESTLGLMLTVSAQSFIGARVDIRQVARGAQLLYRHRSIGRGISWCKMRVAEFTTAPALIAVLIRP